MSRKVKTGSELVEAGGGADLAGGMGSEPVERAQHPAGGPRIDLLSELREQLSDEVVDQLLAGARTEEEIVGPGGVLAQLTKRLVERVLSAELTEHLGYEPHQEPPGGSATPATARRRRRL